MRPGEPKKAVEGGKFTWGNLNEQVMDKSLSDDKNDPNYDSGTSFEYQEDFQSSKIRITHPPHSSSIPGAHVVLNKEFWLFDTQAFNIEIRNKVDEVFNQGTYSGFVSWLRELHRPKLHSFIFARTIQVSLDKPENEQDVAWGLLELLYTAKLLNAREIRRGFDRLYRNINEILIDAPKAPEIILELLSKIILSGAVSPNVILRIPVSFYNLGRGSYVLREIKYNGVVIGDLTETIVDTKEKILKLIKEYYASGVSEGIIEYLKENKIYGSLVVRKSVEVGLDRNNREKELCSRLLAEVSGCCNPETLVEGFDDILWNSKELIIDVPDAANIISKFLARAIVDDCLPANYIHESETIQDETTELPILLSAYHLLKPKEAFTSLESVWGPQANTIEDFKIVFKNIIQELFDSKDLENAEECVKELECAHYMHELIKKLIETVMDKTVSEENLVVELIKRLEVKGIVLEDQVATGIQRVELNLPQLLIDVPKATEILSRIKKELGR